MSAVPVQSQLTCTNTLFFHTQARTSHMERLASDSQAENTRLQTELERTRAESQEATQLLDVSMGVMNQLQKAKQAELTDLQRQLRQARAALTAVDWSASVSSDNLQKQIDAREQAASEMTKQLHAERKAALAKVADLQRQIELGRDALVAADQTVSAQSVELVPLKRIVYLAERQIRADMAAPSTKRDMILSMQVCFQHGGFIAKDLA